MAMLPLQQVGLEPVQADWRAGTYEKLERGAERIFYGWRSRRKLAVETRSGIRGFAGVGELPNMPLVATKKARLTDS